VQIISGKRALPAPTDEGGLAPGAGSVLTVQGSFPQAVNRQSGRAKALWR
jgi:hypothetical protein